MLSLREKNVDMQIKGANCTDDLKSKKIALLLRYGMGEGYAYTALLTTLLYTKCCIVCAEELKT